MSCAAPGPAMALDATGYMGIHVDTCGYMWIYGCMYIYIYIYITYIIILKVRYIFARHSF